MGHMYSFGVVNKKLSVFNLITVSGLFAILLTLGVFATANAAPAATTFQFTQTELETNWGPDRREPTGGYTSVSAFGRSSVAQISIDTSKAAFYPGDPDTQGYYSVEGIKTPKGPAENFEAGKDFGQAVEVDLYLDPAWANTAVRAGLWAVGDNGNGGTDAASDPFGIVEFANIDGYTGFRYFSNSGYVEVAGFTGFGKWVTLKVALNPTADQYELSVNGVVVGTRPSTTDSTFLRNVILNQKNFGTVLQESLNENNYSVHWSGVLSAPTTKEQCKNDGWKSYGIYKNQGDCVSHIATKGRNLPTF